MLPPHLFVDTSVDPLSGSSSAGGGRIMGKSELLDANLTFLVAPQSVCSVCFAIINGPLRKVALTLPESAVHRGRHMWADPQYRKDTPEHVIHLRIVSVGQKCDALPPPRYSGAPSSAAGTIATSPAAPLMYTVNRRYRLHLDAWRPFNKQTRMLFCAVDPVGEEDEASSQGEMTPRERSGSGISAMRRARRKSRTDLVFDVPPSPRDGSHAASSTSAASAGVTLPNKWSLSGTSVFNCELTEVSPSVDGVRLETFSDVIFLAPDDSVASPFTLSTAELYQVVKQTIGFARVRGKVRVSSMKAPSTKLLKKV